MEHDKIKNDGETRNIIGLLEQQSTRPLAVRNVLNTESSLALPANRSWRSLLLAAVSLVAASLLCIPLQAQQDQALLDSGSGSYEVLIGGKKAGSAKYEIQSTGAGFAIRSKGSANLDSLKYSFSREGQVDGNLQLTGDAINGKVNGEAVTFAVTQAGQGLSINISASGKHTSNELSTSGTVVMMPNFDPAAINVLLAAFTRSTAVQALFPQQSGVVQAVTLTAMPDASGTLDDKQIPVRHIRIKAGALESEIYFDEQNNLLQQEIASQGSAMVREGFKLAQSSAPSLQPTNK